MKIHREGFASILITTLLLLGLNLLVEYLTPELVWLHNTIRILSLIMLGLVMQFFRNPARHTHANDAHVIAPADGKVVVIEEVEEPEYFKDKRLQVSIFMSPLNVHVNRNPISGLVKYCKYHPGKYLVAWHPKSSSENERTTVVIENKHKVQVLFKQIAGAVARRIKYYVKEGQPVMQGREMGFIKFGSRVDVLLPLDAKVQVSLNQKVRGGETILAEVPS